MLNENVIQGFVGSILAKRFDGQVASPEFHRECWELCTSPNKFVAIAAPRAHAKSTAVTLGYGLATLLFRERRFMLLVSDTESQASLFLGTFKQELQENQELIALFNIKRNEKGLVQFQKDTETDIIVECEDGHRFRIIAKGAEQKLRGLIWNGSRPDIILGDDMENDELVLNKERREKLRRWFKGALLPCRSDDGIVRIVGTVLHMDSLLERLMPSLTDKETIDTGLKIYSTKPSMWKALKYRAHNSDFTKLLWPAKKSALEFKALYEESQKDGTADVYSQEYLNIPLDESTSIFKRADFLPFPEEIKTLRYYCTIDLAIDSKQTSDYSVFLVSAIDEHRNLYIIDVIRERLDGREIVELILDLEEKYEFSAIGIEDMQVTKAIGPFLREEMLKRSVFPNIYKLTHGRIDKVARSRSIQGRMRIHSVYFNTEADWYSSFLDECLSFPRGKHDDQVDTFSYLGIMVDKLIEAPTLQELDKEEYEEELMLSNQHSYGSNKITGY